MDIDSCFHAFFGHGEWAAFQWDDSAMTYLDKAEPL